MSDFFSAEWCPLQSSRELKRHKLAHDDRTEQCAIAAQYPLDTKPGAPEQTCVLNWALSGDHSCGDFRRSRRIEVAFQQGDGGAGKSYVAKRAIAEVHAAGGVALVAAATAKAATLNERLRWNDELKVYTARIYSATQARLLLKVAKTLAGGEEDLPADIDETVFEEASSTHLTVFPITVHEGPTSQNQEMLAVSGSTFPFKNDLKERGFAFSNTVNDMVLNVWLAPKGTVDLPELTAKFEEYGFTVEEFTGTK